MSKLAYLRTVVPALAGFNLCELAFGTAGEPAGLARSPIVAWGIEYYPAPDGFYACEPITTEGSIAPGTITCIERPDGKFDRPHEYCWGNEKEAFVGMRELWRKRSS